MQKREKMVERRRSEGMAPVMAPRWEMVSRRDWATRSAGRVERRPSRTRPMLVRDDERASAWRALATST